MDPRNKKNSNIPEALKAPLVIVLLSLSMLLLQAIMDPVSAAKQLGTLIHHVEEAFTQGYKS